MSDTPALDARQITEELLESLREYATWLRCMDDPYSRVAVARDLDALTVCFNAWVNGDIHGIEPQHPAAWKRLAEQFGEAVTPL